MNCPLGSDQQTNQHGTMGQAEGTELNEIGGLGVPNGSVVFKRSMYAVAVETQKCTRG
jgi:hypothetical protein